MASISGVQKSVDVRNISVTTTVAANDVARLMYYLNCVLKSCGVDIIQDDLVDHKNYHRLTARRQDMVFLAAYKYSPDELLDKTIFYDHDGSVFTSNNLNVFLEISQDMKLFHAQENVLIVGEEKQASKIMVFKKSWLDEFYTNPMKRNVERLTRIVKGAMSNHCEHCAGRAGKCACSDCPRTAESQCSPTLRLTGIMSGLLQSLNESIEEREQARYRHCAHCKGLDAVCGCEEGCVKPGNSECTIVHKNVSCDACGTTQIAGVRYKCSKCENFDLCQGCYNENRHVQTHSFYRINQMGSSWVLLEARLKEQPKLPPSRPVQERTARMGEASSRGAFFYEHMSIKELKSYLTENGETFDGIFERKELCRMAWESYCDSVSAAELASIMNDVGADISDYRGHAARRNAAKGAFRWRSSPPVIRGTTFQKGSSVTLCGLKAVSMNGMIGTVINPDVDGRVEVSLKGTSRIIRVKAENLRGDYHSEIID